MRRLLAFVVAASFCALGTTGCEDGPLQSFAPVPDGFNPVVANNPGTTPFADPGADAGFAVLGGGQNKIEICTADKKAQVWAEMLMKPILPPTTAAGINMAGVDAMGNVDWHGTTVDEAEKINCQSDVYGDLFGDGNLDNTWGDNGEVSFEYLVSTRRILQMNLWPGYLGTMDFKCSDPDPNKCPYGVHSYQIAITQQIKKDGQPFTLDWIGNNGKNFLPAADELYHALMFQFQPTLPTDPVGVTCFDTGKCIQGQFGDVAYLYIPSLGWAFWTSNRNAAQPTPSVAARLDVFPAKIMGFSFNDPLLKLDQEGPRADTPNGLPLGQAKTPCVLKMGILYSDFLSTCIEVTGDPTKDKDELNKLVGGLTHGTERFHFNIQGVDVNFTDNSLPANDIIHDGDFPHPGDTATSFNVDQSTLGRIRNDYYNDPKMGLVRDNHGMGAVWKEYARLVRLNLLAQKGIQDGDLTKCQFPVGWNAIPGFDPVAFMNNMPAYCTGFEGFITTAPSSGPNDFTNLGMKALDINSAMKIGLKLGHQKIALCADANGGDKTKMTGYIACDAPYGAQGDIFQTSFAYALRVFGKGKLANMPNEVQDVRFFFRMWVQALVKYLMCGRDENPVIDSDVQGCVINPDDLFFDSIGAGQFELAEYVDRRFTTMSQDPTDFVFEADVRNGIQDAYVFSRDLTRGETAIYVAINEKPGVDPNGFEENALLTNIFGSPILASGWKDVTDPNDKTKVLFSAYYCATHYDPADCNNQLPPNDHKGHMLLDSLGRPILQPYPGAFGTTTFTLGPSKIRLKEYPLIQQAMIDLPLHTNPYDPKSKGLPLYSILVPWAPKQPGVGFPVALSGTLDKFIETAQLDLSGTTITANIDYDIAIDPQTMMPNKSGTISFLAVETTDFLGDVFLCQDSDTGDILKARMYDTVSGILDWLASHPKAYDNCQMIIRYSPFGNYADYITSLTGGVRLGITQGGGFGRVVDVTLFVPGQ